MVAEVGGAAAAAVEGAIEGYYFDRRVDKLSEAIEKVMASAHLKAKSFIADGFSRVTIQQIELFRHIDLSLDGIKNAYESEMHLTVDKVDKKAQGLLAMSIKLSMAGQESCSVLKCSDWRMRPKRLFRVCL